MLTTKKKVKPRRKQTPTSRVPIKVWCDGAWGGWLSGFAARADRSLVGLVTTAIVELARHGDGIEPPHEVIEQASSMSLNGPGHNTKRNVLLIFIRPPVRQWIRDYARQRRQNVASLIETALAFYADRLQITPPPMRTLTETRIPRF